MGFNLDRYYFVNTGDTPIRFPLAERYGGGTRDLIENDDVHVRDSGRITAHKRSTRRRWRFPYRMTPTNRAFFETMHKATDGSVRPFYFLEDLDELRPTVVEDYQGAGLHGEIVNPYNAVDYPRRFLVRKQSNFEPKELDTPASVDGVMLPFEDYMLELVQEPPRIVVGVTGASDGESYAEMTLSTTSGVANYSHLLLSGFPEPTAPIVSATVFVKTQCLMRDNAGEALFVTWIQNHRTVSETGSAIAELQAVDSIDVAKATYSATIAAADFPGGANLYVISFMWHSLFQSFTPPLAYRIFDCFVRYNYV